MNIIAAIASFINSDTSTPLDATLGKKSDAAGVAATNSMFSWIKNIWNTLSAVNTNVNAINANTARGAVKSVQRGTLGAFTTSQTVQDTTITISNVTPAKCGVTISGGYASGSSAAQVTAPRVISLSAASLVINQGHYTVSNTTYFGQVSWQVVEYY